MTLQPKGEGGGRRLQQRNSLGGWGTGSLGLAGEEVAHLLSHIPNGRTRQDPDPEGQVSSEKDSGRPAF